jgi:hypothetical protein
MAVNFTNVTYGSAPRGWTAGSISPRAPITGPIANIPTSGNIPSNILQAIGNLNAQQAFRQFLTGMNVPQPQAAPVMTVASDPAALLRAQTADAQQKAAAAEAQRVQRALANIGAQINAIPTGFGGITPMGGVAGAERANLMQNRFDLQNQLATANSAAFGVPRMSGWMGPVSMF